MSFAMQSGKIKIASPGKPVLNPNNTDSFTEVEFPTPFPSGATVIVIPMVQTFNGTDTPGLRITDVDRRGFKIRMNELVVRPPDGGPRERLSDGNHTAEEIGWIAIATVSD